MAFCENCGKEISAQAIACPNCGHPAQGARATGPVAPGGQPYAEWWKRVLASLLDGLIIGIPSFILIAITNIGFAASEELHFDQTTGEIVGGSGFFAGFFVSWGIVIALGILYRVILEGGPRGQTVGKMALQIRLRDANTDMSIGYGRAFLRWFVASVLWLLLYIPGIIDVLFPLWDQKRQTIHDKAANSVVVVAS